MNKFVQLAKQAQEHESYWEEHVKLQFATQLLEAMEESNLSQRQFATRAGVSESQISQILAGSKNLSIKSMIKYAMALDRVVNVSLQSRKTKDTVSFTKSDSDEWSKFMKKPSPSRVCRNFWKLLSSEEDTSVYRAGNDARVPQAA